eukprot:Blabericola_migrator_1__1370@NODE_1356_length_4729_cov_1432_602746_g897_i1_p1_GENE_NODE_1356_length_4729_cov_1432_602746_g897_i1NODE_1356_length_4729_cov_1432_602746_g897_i1_p1_ORF_typecomplete_len561_score127_12PP2C/PF00481_21/5_1e09PP2C/PF00481_21/2_2e51PP2C_2/PF13672_6/0_1PP2C_2/PF13672_6/9_5e11SpoIIE/PF07228_12/2_2e07HAUS4/PF14735_6/0_2_NODE_1356_length_4729_cov_1432_602746_g897_i112652947
MGVYLSKAKTTKESDDGGNPETDCTRYGVSAMQGWRQSMEDAHITLPKVETVQGKFPHEVSLYGVFDGHGGPTVSEWIARHFSEVLAQTVETAKKDLTEKTLETNAGRDLPTEVSVMCEALQRTFLQLDCDMQTKESREEIQRIHEHLQQKQKESEPQEQDNNGAFPYRSIFQSQPKTLLQALLSGTGGRPMIKIVEQDGERFFQISPPEDDEEEPDRVVAVDDDDGSNEDHQQGSMTDTNAKEADAAVSMTEPAAEKEASDMSELPKTSETATSGEPDSNKVVENDNEGERWMEASIEASAKDDVFDPSDPASYSNKTQMPTWGPENCGAAAIVAALIGGETPYLVTANAGDSRCVLCRDGKAISMSEDHKPGLAGENSRIVKAGGTVIGGRVDGNLNLSRTIGDLFYKSNKELRAEEQKITAFPDVRIIPITKDDEFVILACDGIWDCVTNQEAVDFVRERLGENPSETKLSKICEELCDHCLAENPVDSEGGIGCDNMTCIVVLLNDKVRRREAKSADVILYESTKVTAPTGEKTEAKTEDASSPLVGDKVIDVSAQ